MKESLMKEIDELFEYIFDLLEKINKLNERRNY